MAKEQETKQTGIRQAAGDQSEQEKPFMESVPEDSGNEVSGRTDEEDYAAELAKCRSVLRYVSIRVPDMAWYEAFFTEVFGMHTEQKQMSGALRRTTFVEGIVLVYEPGMEASEGDGGVEKICLDVDDSVWTLQEALKMGCTAAEDPQEVRLPNGVLLRVQDMEA